jgi:hypothetical protein
MHEQTYNVGIVLTSGYLTASIEADDIEGALSLIDSMIAGRIPVHGSFGLPGCPGHRPAYMLINPAQLVGIIHKP